MITLLIVNYNNASQVVDYVDRVCGFPEINHILIIDNASTDDSLTFLETISSSKVEVVSSGKNGGYGYGNNFGIRYAAEIYHSDIVLISNADVYYEQALIQTLENYMRLKHVAVTAAVMTEPDGKNVYPWKVPSGWQYILDGVPILHRFVKSSDYQHDFFTTQEEAIEVECVPGSLLMVNVADFLEIDGYDEDIFLYCEETCLGYKLKSAQKKTVLLTSSSYVHDHKRNSNQLLKQRKAIWDSRKIFIRKYYNFSNFDMLLANLLEHFDLFIRAHRR